ncbi:strawberry notch family protein [Rhodomicrobium vannielii ATCC 17100]|uniref:strawberry notch-like NTP hydrolase domain-containing protein n=1 Tax=Rhodomicrobium vannielii TaxID=1069 RepID=UPI001918D985|nr:strawberry notch family protein [Rhodomicrobium vannielii]MBJ7533245.1 strawberry notch family protein [Rhodomicrobium vannielii ATCC 17100]
MTPVSHALAATLDAAPDSGKARIILDAATLLVPSLAKGEALDARVLRAALEHAAGGSDTEGVWCWKDAYEASEAALVLFLRRFGQALLAKAVGDADKLASLIGRIEQLMPSQTRRSEESLCLQQFSTPPGIGEAIARAARLSPADVVLEPSAGTGLLAIGAELRGTALILNELAEMRRGILQGLFSGAPVFGFNAEQIDDFLPAEIIPSVVLMNPPFSTTPHVDGGSALAGLRHVSSALARLSPRGRLVALLSERFDPCSSRFAESFAELGEKARLVFHATLDGALYQRHGTTTATRLLVFDKESAGDVPMPASSGHATSLASLFRLVDRGVPERMPGTRSSLSSRLSLTASSLKLPLPSRPALKAAPMPAASVSSEAAACEPLFYERKITPADRQPSSDRLYEPYAVQTIAIAGAKPHPTALVQSASMASVAPPMPSYKPLLPGGVVTERILSDAQLETVVYAGEAHKGLLDGYFRPDESFDRLDRVEATAEGAVQYRKGYFLGDGTGCGKGRQAAGILLDNWLQGRRKAIWISKSDKLLEDAQRDWSALGQEKLQIVPLTRTRQGQPIKLRQGILFTTYATLRSSDRGGKHSRLRQILDWLGSGFDGVILFDEAHAMANATGSAGARGAQGPSQQGVAGLRLQHALPLARVVYVSATGATTVQNLGYAQRLGLWGGTDFPFATRADFIQAIEAGGIAAMEVLARDLKALGLYTARSLSYDGVEVDILEHALTDEQIRIYDAYAGAFQIIHQNLNDALEAANITGPEGTLNARAKAAAKSAFESNKQRFFNHLITAMKTPAAIRAIEANLERGHAAIVQLVSTAESLMERRLSEIPTEEWSDLSIDVTPREYVLDYLSHGFPTQLFERYTDADGNLQSRPVLVDGQPVHAKEAVARQDALIEKLASLAPVPGALDQIVQHFGGEKVAEVTGRSRRLVRKQEPGGSFTLQVENRPALANLSETQAFMNDEKRVLVFSDAGGTGRSYHADRGCKNQRRRIHYLLEPGWRADAAIQGLGRSNRTNQAQPPLFRPVATDVRGEKRFLSTIAKRLDSMGAITRGQRQTGGQGLFRESDNLESVYARDALRRLYDRIFRGQCACLSLEDFEEATGLSLCDSDGTLKEELPPISTFLNRLLALPIALQNRLFEEFEALLDARIEGAIQAGIYDLGLETLTGEKLAVTARLSLARHGEGGAETALLTIEQHEKLIPLSLEEVLSLRKTGDRLLVNERTGRAALATRTSSFLGDEGEIIERLRLLRPLARESMALADLDHSAWKECDPRSFAAAWEDELKTLPAMRVNILHLVTGLLLPVWRKLPDKGCRIFRLTTTDGERLIGRLIRKEDMPSLEAAFGLDAGSRSVSAGMAIATLLEGRSVKAGDGFVLRKCRVMARERIELTGFRDGEVPALKALGLVSEIIAWRLRLFLPLGEATESILTRLGERYPLSASGGM